MWQRLLATERAFASPPSRTTGGSPFFGIGSSRHRPAPAAVPAAPFPHVPPQRHTDSSARDVTAACDGRQAKSSSPFPTQRSIKSPIARQDPLASHLLPRDQVYDAAAREASDLIELRGTFRRAV